MKKLLLTGSNGFIGSYFIKGYEHKYDITTFSFLKDDFESLYAKGIDVILHLSALVHQKSGVSADEYERVNITNTLKLAKKAKESRVGHFIFMSTVKVYGEESKEIYTESFTCKPQDEYGQSKLKAERELQKLGSEDFIVSIIRTPIVYGYGVKANIENLINLIRTSPILPFANIENQRSFVYVGNLCALVDKVIETKKSGIFLACDDKPLSTTRLIELIATGMGKKVYLVKLPFFKELLRCLKPSIYKRLYKNLEVDNTQTRKLLDFKNPYTVEEGIFLMIQGVER